jgi:8-oxo-dGTP pyrophosphatase MutT (NUDIX family)
MARKSGAKVIPVNKYRVALFRRDFNTSTLPGKWVFIGGGIEDGESPEEAARRECREETGFTPQQLLFIGSTPDNQHYFLAPLNNDEAFQVRRQDEGLDVKWFSFGEILKFRDEEKLGGALLSVFLAKERLFEAMILCQKPPHSPEVFGRL